VAGRGEQRPDVVGVARVARIGVAEHQDRIPGRVGRDVSGDLVDVRAPRGGRFVDVDLDCPDFLRLAAAYGVPATRVADKDSFADAIVEALDRRGPSLIEVTDEWRNLRV